jgi:hypothetical protein
MWRASVLIFSVLVISVAAITIEEAQKRLDDAFMREDANLQKGRMQALEKILSTLETEITKGKITTCWQDTMAGVTINSYGVRPDGMDDKFCRWWNERFRHVDCVFERHQTCFWYVNHPLK